MSSNAIALPVSNSTSTYDTVKNSVVDAASWCGRQVHTVFSAIASGVSKIASFVAPAFQAIGRFFAEKFETVKELLVRNKHIAIPVTAAFALGAIAFGLFKTFASDKPAEKLVEEPVKEPINQP